MRLALQVTFDDDTEAVTTTATTPDFIAWEAKFSRNWLTLVKDTTLTDKCFLAWSSLHGAEGSPSFDEWIKTVDFVSVVDSEEPVPLDQTQPTGD